MAPGGKEECHEAQMEMVFDYLRKHNVGIGEPGDQDAFMTEEERDYLQMYLDEIEVPLHLEQNRNSRLGSSSSVWPQMAHLCLVTLELRRMSCLNSATRTLL